MILKTTNIVKAYKGRKVVDNVNIKVSQGEIVGLLGPNGAGKTTCFYMMVGLIKSDLGSILLNDKNISCLLYTSPSPRDKRQSRMPSSA